MVRKKVIDAVDFMNRGAAHKQASRNGLLVAQRDAGAVSYTHLTLPTT